MTFIKRLFDVRPGERAKTLFMAGYFFLTIAIVYILKPIRSSLFIEDLGAENLRYAYMAEGLFLIFVVAVYIQLSRMLPKKVFFPAILSFFAFNLVVFWALFRMNVPYLSGPFYVWVDSFTITITTQFWLLANDIFTTEQGKRLFGMIISAGSLGGIAGGFLTGSAVQWIKTEDLLLITALFVGICVALTLATESLEFKSNYDEFTAGSKDPEAPDSGEPVHKIFIKHPYFIYLTLLVIVAKIASTVIDNQFTASVETFISGKEARTAFFGHFMAWLNVASFIMQLLVTGVVLRKLEINSLWILPVGLALFTLGGWFFPLFGVMMAMRVFDGSVNYSIQQASKELLFLPIPGALRPRVKPVIDMLGFRLAKSMGGFYIAFATTIAGVHSKHVGIVTIGLVPLWFLIVAALKKEYPKLKALHQQYQPASGK